MKKRFIFLLFVLMIFSSLGLSAQVKGTITDENKLHLPFASVHVQGTSKGTTSNAEGQYTLSLDPGTYDLVYQYLGYKSKLVNVSVGKSSKTLDVSLDPDSYTLKEVEVLADSEDPAYPIIRKAIKKRKYYKDLLTKYKFNAYVKGLQKITDAPEKILGQEVGDMDGMLDSTGQGIVYLSESESIVYFLAPDKKKEVMLSSKVSGNDNGFSFNRASLMDFNFYENTIDIGRELISPIAPAAFSYYKYKLVGTFLDEGGRLVNKIQVIRKREEDPVFFGYINIVEDLWNIQGVDLYITGKAIQQPILDTLLIRQIHVPVEAPDKWVQFSQTLDFDLEILGFRFGGYFIGVFSDYDLNPDFPEDLFKGEIFKVSAEAKDTKEEYWIENRPIPLTEEEQKDYVVKDSIQEVRNSPEYRDSVDRANNRFQVGDILSGYRYQKSRKQYYVDFSSPLESIQFNSVQGWLGSVGVEVGKYQNKAETRYFKYQPRVTYGFSDERLRGSFTFIRKFDGIYNNTLRLSAGKEVVQFNAEQPISSSLNTFYSLWRKENFQKLYENRFGSASFGREWINGLFAALEVTYSERVALDNNSNISIRDRGKDYEPNTPLGIGDGSDFFERHDALIFNLNLRIRPGQEFLSFPEERIVTGSDFPTFRVNYTKAIDAFGTDLNYDKLSLGIEHDFSFRLVGKMEVFAQAGAFLNDNRVEFMDFFHQLGNQTAFTDPERFLKSYGLLPYYQLSTNDQFTQVHFQHHFNGFLLDKVPIIRKFQWRLVAKGAWLHLPDQADYYEASIGVDNIGIGFFRLLRVDFVTSFLNGEYEDFGILVGFGL